MSLKDRFAWVLVAASALAAMVVGHAIELWLEGIHAFGERAASYHHVAQSGVAEAAIILFLFVAVASANRLVELVSHHQRDDDRVLPALSAISAAGFVRVAPPLAVLQLVALLAAEIAEQHLSGYQGNAFVAVLGPGHASALVVHLTVAAIVTFSLCRFASFAVMRSEAFVDAVVIFFRRALMPINSGDRADRRFAPRVVRFSRGSALLSLGLANRPPPAFATFA